MLTLMDECWYAHAKAACYICEKPGPDIIDTGVQIEGEGVLAVCVSCVVEMAVTAGKDPGAADEVEQMAQIVATLNEQLKDEKGLTKRLRKQLREARASTEVSE